MNTIHSAAALAIYHAGLWDFITTQSNDAKAALTAVAGLILMVIAVVMLIRYHHSIGKLVAGGVVLVIGGALITGSIVTALQGQVNQTVNQGEGTAPYSVTQQL